MPVTLDTNPIGVFDSGIGGLSVANAVSGLLPRESLLYVADNAYAPYGPRPAAEILERSRRLTAWLLARGAKLIVVACNTATSVAIDALRAEYRGLPFVGLEPAVKPASQATRVGVLATRATLASERYRTLRAAYFGDRPVIEDSCAGLVPLIEAEGAGGPGVKARLAEILAPMTAASVDTLVLGCTHYPLVAADITGLCGPDVRLIDPSPAAARQVERLLVGHGLTYPAASSLVGTRARAQTADNRETDAPPVHAFYATGAAGPLQRTLLRLPDLNRHRKWVVPRLVV